MKTIYKYPIVVGYNTMNTYENCQILSAGLDPKGIMSIWVLVDTQENKTNQLKILVMGTGWDFPPLKGSLDFIGSVKEDAYIWHIFLETSDEEVEDIDEHEEAKRLEYILTGEQ